MRLLIALAIATLVLIPPAASPAADEMRPPSDVNVVTAVDVSDSIMRHEEWLQMEALAKAVTSAPVLDAIAGGRHGRIGFAVYTWSSAGRFELVVPSTLIGSLDDAEGVAAALRGFAIDRSSWRREWQGAAAAAKTSEHRTDISSTIEFATSLVLTAPHAAPHMVVNVCANGTDNVAEDPRAARDRAMAAGIIINGLVIGGKEGLARYFREHVQGGAGSFVMNVTQPAVLTDAMVNKLLRDLIAGRPPAARAVPFT